MPPHAAPPFTLADAYALAQHDHAGQTDKQGRDYFGHHLVPIAKALAPRGEFYEMAGILHDWIEDPLKGDIDRGVRTLRDKRCSEVVIAAIVSVTRIPGESYRMLIRRAAVDRYGCEVKLFDNAHNIASNPGLAKTDPGPAESLLHRRYLPARDELMYAAALHDAGLSDRVQGYLDERFGVVTG